MNSVHHDDAVERLVRAAVSRFAAEDDLEDKMQIGRLAVLRCLDRRPEIGDDIERNSDFLFSEIARAVMRERLNPTVERPRLSRRTPPAAETYGDALDAVCRRRHGAGFAVLRAQVGDKAILDLLRKDSVAHPSSRESKAAVVWALAAIEDLSLAAIPKKINYPVFVDRGLGKWLWAFFGNSPFRAINHAYPGKFLPHQMAVAPLRHWRGPGGKARAVAALKGALESTGHPESLYPKIANERFFEKFKLTSPLQQMFDGHFAFLDAAFPGRFHPWEMAVTPAGHFDLEENVVAAVRWLVEERLKMPISRMTVAEIWRDRLAEKVTKDVFEANGLREIMAAYGSPESVMRMAFPGKFLDWSFQRKSKWQGPAGRKLAATATRWLFDEYLGLDPADERITCETFRKHGLWGMLTSKSLGFNSSPMAALCNAYPGRISEIRRPSTDGKATKRRRPRTVTSRNREEFSESPGRNGGMR